MEQYPKRMLFGKGSPFSSAFYGWVGGREGGRYGPNSVKTHFKQRWRRKTKRKGGAGELQQKGGVRDER